MPEAAHVTVWTPAASARAQYLRATYCDKIGVEELAAGVELLANGSPPTLEHADDELEVILAGKAPFAATAQSAARDPPQGHLAAHETPPSTRQRGDPQRSWPRCPLKWT